MKPIIIIAIAVGAGAIIVILGGNYSVLNQMNEGKSWIGLSCDEMIDFSGSDEHHSMHDFMHMKFHNYYFDHCSETESGTP